MGHFFLGVLGMFVAVMMLRYREYFGNALGEAEWMRKIGGVYSVIIYTAILTFLFSAVVMFGLTDVALRSMLGPLKKVGFG